MSKPTRVATGRSVPAWNPRYHADARRKAQEAKANPLMGGFPPFGLRTDSWYNTKSTFGGMNDPVIRSVFARTRVRMERTELDSMYEQDWLSARVVDKLPDDATRNWLILHHETDPKKAEDLSEQDRRLNGRGLFNLNMKWARLYGMSLNVMGLIDGNAPEQPVDIERINQIKFAHITDRYLATPLTNYSEDDEGQTGKMWGEVETYLCHRLGDTGGSMTSIVHESRTIRFDGPELPPMSKVRNWGYGQSVIEKVYDSLRNWGMSNQAAAAVIPTFVTIAFQIGNLSELITNKDWPTINARIAEVRAQMAVHNVLAFGDGENVQKMGTDIAGLPQLLELFMQIVSAACDIPMSILFQAQSGSMGGNAAGTDQENWDRSVRSFQEVVMRPKVRRWLDIIGAPLGLKPGEVEFEFAPLTQMTASEESEVYYRNAQADEINVRNGLVDSPARLGVHRFGGKRYNHSAPVLDTKRQEAFLKKLDATPVELPSEGGFEPTATGTVGGKPQPEGDNSLTSEGNPQEKDQKPNRLNADEIGFTTSGRVVKALVGHESFQDFTVQDHKDAADLHERLILDLRNDLREGKLSMSQNEVQIVVSGHALAASAHRQSATNKGIDGMRVVTTRRADGRLESTITKE